MDRDQLAVIGSINVDHIMNIEQFPRPGETVFGKQYKISFGGKGANQAVAAARSGAKIVFIACVGDDDPGQWIIQQLAKENIDIHAIETQTYTATGAALIFVNGEGENVIGINAGANTAVTPTYLSRYQELVINSKYLLMQLESPLETIIAAAKLAKQHQTQIILNPAPARKLPDELLTLIDIITPNETEAEYLTGVNIEEEADAAKASGILHDKGINTVIITLGKRGVWFSVQGKGKYIPGFKVKVVDTIAAGDTFNGALVTALLEGQDIELAIQFAQGAAAIAITRSGAQSSIPWRVEIDNFLQQG